MYRILLVDDEKETLHAIERIFLDASDCELHYAASGREAVAAVRACRPDVILLDIMMPDMDGYEVCQRLKADPGTADSMVLYLSARNRLDDRLKGYETLADDYLAKPYEPQELLAKVRILLRLKKAQDTLRETNRNLERVIEQRTRELIVRERQATVGRLVHGIVHNLQNPLMAAFCFSDLVKNNLDLLLPLGPDLPPVQQKAVSEAGEQIRKVFEALNRFQELIDNLLRKGRKEAATQGQRLRINELLTAEIAFLEADPEFKHQVTKELRLDPGLPVFSGMYADFSQIFGTIITNAVDAMRPAATKKITITTRHDHANIFVDFQDTGPGIAAEVLDHIFEPFFSTKAAKGTENTDEPSGTGLGLYTSQQLIGAYHGSLTVRSEPPAGAIFTVTIPYSNDREAKNERGV